MVYSGSVLNAPLSAEANDPDGTIAEVIFYANGLLVGSDSSRPYAANFEINATYHYEVYAVARDNSGNLVTSNVRRIVVDEGGESQDESLTLSASSAYLGGISEIGGVYTSRSGIYDPNIRALVYLDGVHVGDADILPRTPLGHGEEDPSQGFTYDLPALNLEGYDIEIIIINGDETASLSQSINVSASPVTDAHEFLIGLWEGLFDRKPQGAEISAYLSALRDGSMTRQQVIASLRNRGEFIRARDIVMGDKILFGNWQKLTDVLEKLTSQVMAAVGVILYSNKHLLECHFQFQMTMEQI